MRLFLAESSLDLSFFSILITSNTISPTINIGKIAITKPIYKPFDFEDKAEYSFFHGSSWFNCYNARTEH